MATPLEKIIDLLCDVFLFQRDKITTQCSVYQDLKISGDDAEEFVDCLADMFGDWLREWPWQSYVDFNEPGYSLGPKIWKFLRLPNPEMAFLGFTENRLELGHIAAVIEKGEWFEP